MEIKTYIQNFPQEPGCYIMKNKKQTIIYIGKAKRIKQRVSSYFSGEQSTKTQHLLKEVAAIEYIVTKTEAEALLLENEMIKTHLPKYNILLKDDKTYPYIHITNEDHPKLTIARQVKQQNGDYFGPYPNGKSAKEVVDILNRLYPFRKCSGKRKKPCLHADLGQCIACLPHTSKKDYQEFLKEVRTFLKGDYGIVLRKVEEKMQIASENLQFELAKEHLEVMKHIKQLQPNQHIILPDKVDRDVWGWYHEGDVLSIQVLHARHGAIVERAVYQYEGVDSIQEEVERFILQFYHKHLLPKELLLPERFPCDTLAETIPTKVLQPKRGDKKKLVNMANRNVEHAFKMARIKEESKEQKKTEGMKTLRELLGLALINRVEIFDNAHIQGVHTVSGVVVYEQHAFQRKDYRKFRLKHDNGADDLASMKEVLERRYTRILSEGGKLPDLIVIDGGKTQWHTAQIVIHQLRLQIPVISLTKDDKHRTNGVIDTNGQEHIVQRSSPLYRLIASWQEEVHRFVITYFRSLQQKEMKQSSLDAIRGVGKARKIQLLTHFKSVDKIKKADIETLKQAGIPLSTAQAVWDYYHRKE